MPLDRYAVGIQLGGRKLHGGLSSPRGPRVARQTEAWKGPGGVLASLEGRITGLADSSDRFRVAGIDLAVPGRQIHPPHALRIPGGRLGEPAGIAAADPRWASA